MELEKALINFAKADLKTARTQGVVLVHGTKAGNVQIRLVHGRLYRFENFNTGELLGWNTGALALKEAVPLLSKLYQVEAA